MKDTYTIRKTTDLVGTLMKDDNDNLMVEIYGKDGLEDRVDMTALLEESVGKQIAFKVVEEY